MRTVSLEYLCSEQEFRGMGCMPHLNNVVVFSLLRTLTTWHYPHSPSHVALLCAMQQSIDISCRSGPQQHVCNNGFAAVGPCWDRQTDRRIDPAAHSMRALPMNHRTPPCDCFRQCLDTWRHCERTRYLTLTTPLSGKIFLRQGGTCYGKPMYQI